MKTDGEQDARMRALYRDAYGFVRDRARALLRDDEEARDVAQEVFMRAFERRGTVLAGESPLGWLLVAATRMSLDRLRHRKIVRAHRQAPADVVEAAAAGTAAARHDQLRQLVQLLEAEEPLGKQVVLHTVVDGMTQDEAAAALGVSRKTVQRHLDAFKQKHAGGQHG
jgi:RNA polymerase sigma-70 factor, ECF subfamily